MKAYKANIVFTPSPDAFRVVERGYVVVDDGGRVVDVYEHLPEEFASVEVTDFGDKLLIPAFCDLHVHAPQYRNMGLAMDMELLPWLNAYTFPEEMKFSDEDYAKRLYSRFVHELWMQGTMRCAVFATVHLSATMLLADLFNDAGMGAYIGLVGMNRHSPNGLTNTTEQLVKGMQKLVEHCNCYSNHRVHPIVTPRFVPSCTPDMLQALGNLAHEYQLPVQSHLSENMSEIVWVSELEPESTSYGDAYNKYGLFGQTPTLMAHCCYTEGKELQLMRQNHVFAVHCPTSNCNLASGMASVRTLLDNNVPVALGTDISGGNHASILRVMQYALQVSKLQYANSHGKQRFLSLSETFYLGTKSGGQFFGKVGSFEPGYEFDALVVDDHYLNFDNYSLLHRIERYVYLGDDRDIKARFCSGQLIDEPKQY